MHIAKNLNWLAPRFYDPGAGLLVISIQSFLIRRNGFTILLDTCSGENKERHRPVFHRRQWPWLEKLCAAGVTPEDVDLVMCSHLHVDHVGWNTRLENGRWVPTFPNAHYLIAKKEWEYWELESSNDRLHRTGDYVVDSVLPVFEAGQVKLIEEDHMIDEGIWLQPTPGHTPGHFAVHFEGNGNEIIFSGDLIHHPLQVRYPEWSTRFCADPDMARQSRRHFLETHAGSGRMILPAHFPNPSGIFLESRGDRFGFRFDGEDHPIAFL